MLIFGLVTACIYKSKNLVEARFLFFARFCLFVTHRKIAKLKKTIIEIVSAKISRMKQKIKNCGFYKIFALMGEGLIFLTRDYFMEGALTPFWHVKNVLLLIIWSWNFTGSKMSHSRLALKNSQDDAVCSVPWKDVNDVIDTRHL